MNRLDPNTETINSTKRKSVSEGKANGLRRGLRATWMFWAILHLLLLRGTNRQTSHDRIGQQFSLGIRKCQSAGFFIGQLVYICQLCRSQWGRGVLFVFGSKLLEHFFDEIVQQV